MNISFSEDVVLSDVELLKKLYVQTPDRTKFDNRIKMHISKRHTPFLKVPTYALKSSGAKTISEKITNASKNIKPLIVLVLGTVGAGKTTFLNYIRKVSNSEQFKKIKGELYPHWIYIDYRDLSPEENPSEFLFDKLFSYIVEDDFLSDHERCVQVAYKSEITAMLRGPLQPLADDQAEVNKRISDFLLRQYDAKKPYVEAVLGYASKHVPVFLVIDNIDQFEEADFQSRIFSDASAVSHRLNLNLFIALRDATYITNRNQPLFDAFDFDPIYVDPPKIDSVLSKRFFVARQLLEGQPASFTAENGAEVKLENKAIIIDLIQASVLGTEVGRLIEVMATGDVRLALRITREFLQYGYTATGTALKKYHETGKYILPMHEALRAIMLGNRAIYSDDFSVVGNPFDSKLSRTQCQLIRLYILTALVNLGSTQKFQSCSGEDIRGNLRNIGFGDDVVLDVLKDLCRFRFIHTLSHTPPSFEAEFVPSRLGGYIVRELIANFAFLENIMVDTFIADKDVWGEVYSLTRNVYAEKHPVKRLGCGLNSTITEWQIYAPLLKSLS